MLIASKDYLKRGKFSNTVATAGAIQCDTFQDTIVPWSVTVSGKANNVSSRQVGRRRHRRARAAARESN